MISRVLKTEEGVINKLIFQDPLLEKLINACGPLEMQLPCDYFSSLASSIVGQQLSSKVSEVIWNRVVSLLNGEINPQNMLSIEVDELRGIGVSYSKIGYLRNLSNAVLSKRICLDNFESSKDEEIIEILTSVKGIGRWTAEMFLIFSLGREDVFSLGDGGLKRSIVWMYQLSEVPEKEQLEEISEAWKPYRTYASLYLWEAINRGMTGNHEYLGRI
jgi:DNA-3-methyladenine glycosylase II